MSPALPGPKAVSVLADGGDDGFVPKAGWASQVTPDGETRIAVHLPLQDLARTHQALIRALTPPLSVLYRQKIDRRDPKPAPTSPRDFVGLELSPGRVLRAVEDAAILLYADARCELWIRGKLGDQLVLDEDGTVFCYPDDPSYREVLSAEGVPAADVQAVADRDYVKHWFRAEADALEDALLLTLALAEVPRRA